MAKATEKQKTRMREYYRKNKHIWAEREKQFRVRIQEIKLDSGCTRCGYNKCAAALDFHHTRDKRFKIATATCRRWEVVEREIQKCIVLCRNCHAEVHSEFRNSNR